MTEIFGSNCYVYEYEDIFYTWDNFYEDDLVDMHLNFFVENENGSYDRIYEYQQERVYSIEEIKNMVSKSGFEEIKIYDEDDFSSIKEDSQRILISAVKGK